VETGWIARAHAAGSLDTVVCFQQLVSRQTFGGSDVQVSAASHSARGTPHDSDEMEKDKMLFLLLYLDQGRGGFLTALSGGKGIKKKI